MNEREKQRQKKIAIAARCMSTCIECTHFAVEPGMDGYYPGEYTPISIGCAKQIWTLDNEDNRDTVIRNLETSKKCEHFDPEVA